MTSDNCHYLITWDGLLPPVPAAEAGHAARDDHHQADADRAHDQEELQVDLTVLAGKPGVAVAADLGAVQDALAIPVTQLTLSAGP